jgi:hypothetical protein
MTEQTLAANTTAKAAASTAAAAIVRVVQAGVSKKVTMLAAVVEALSAASAREFCKALGLWYPLAKSGVAVPLTGTTTETVLAAITIPAGAMGPNGAVRVTTIWSHPNSANQKTMRYRLGSADILGALIMNIVLSANTGAMLQRIVHNRNAQNSQISGSAGNAASFGAFATVAVTAAVDMSADQSFVITGQLASAGETITLESYLVEVLYGA